MRDKYSYGFLDFAKGYAICGIVLYHALQKVALPPVAQQAIGLGGTGVHLFFLLSGLGLMLSAFSGGALAFYQRRGIKIWRPYFVALTLSMVVNWFVPLFPSDWRAWLAGVLIYQMFVDAYIEGFGGHFWFISAIIQLYLVFPLLQMMLHRLGGRGEQRTKQGIVRFVILCFALSLAWWLLVFFLDKTHSRCWTSFFLQYLWEFGLGMGIGVLIRQNGIQGVFAFAKKYAWLGFPVAVLGFGAMALLARQFGKVGQVFNDVPALIGYAGLCYAAYEVLGRLLPWIRHFFTWINGFSFSLYLTHVLVLELYLHALAQAGISPSLPLLLPYFVLALIAGWAFSKFKLAFSS